MRERAAGRGVMLLFGATVGLLWLLWGGLWSCAGAYGVRRMLGKEKIGTALFLLLLAPLSILAAAGCGFAAPWYLQERGWLSVRGTIGLGAVIAAVYLAGCSYWVWRCVHDGQPVEDTLGFCIGVGLFSAFVCGLAMCLYEKLTGKKLFPD